MSQWLAHLCADANDKEFVERVAVVVAHPDDEVIGVGGLLPRLRRATFIHTTDGAPRSMSDVAAAGFTTPADYAQARRNELYCALALAGISPMQTRTFDFVDQEASLALVELTRKLVHLLQILRAEVVLTHPYEGGHPDHDATAFAVHAAHQLIEKTGAAAPLLIEFTSYHNHNGSTRCGEFLPRENYATDDAAAPQEATVILTPKARQLKKRMFACFASQIGVLSGFTVDHERFRFAPRYDFSQPPHAGRLDYERHDWNWTGERWRALAHKAMIELGISGGKEF